MKPFKTKKRGVVACYKFNLRNTPSPIPVPILFRRRRPSENPLMLRIVITLNHRSF
jgi:hypothetical protein